MSFYETFTSKIVPELKKDLKVNNIWAVPRLDKVCLGIGIGTLTKNTKDFSDVLDNLARIAGQKPVVTKSKKAISNFKLREGVPAGLVVTLRGKRMYDFIYRLVNIALPRVRDFRGISPKAFDGKGNYSIGFKEATVFPEINPDDVLNVHGLQINIITTARNDEQGFTLLKHLGFPFKK
jgi:large subunit ribosomal protein L5